MSSITLDKLQLSKSHYQILRFTLYTIAILLLNLAASFFAVRTDLTEQKTYSLAPASQETVATLEEPVTIRIYLSSNLPSTYNILSSLLRDLLQTYRSSAKRNMFSYAVNLIRSDDKSEKTAKLQKEAEKYGIYPVQLQGSDGNEFKAVSAYIGMAITQGDNQEILSPLSPSDNIQYKITAALQKMSRKSSALLSMTEDLKIYYYFSPEIAQLEGGKYAAYPQNFEQVMESTAEQLYGRVSSQIVDPKQLPAGFPSPGELDLAGATVSAGESREQIIYSAVVIDHEGKYQAFSSLQMQPTVELGPEGLRQTMALNVIDPLQFEGQLPEIVIGSLGIAQNIGYIADRETASLDPPNPQRPGQGVNLYQFSSAARDLYKFQAVNLDEGIAKDVNILFLVDPMRQLSDWDLYQIDQFVMRGGRLITAIQPYQVMQNPYGYGAQYIPNPNIVGGPDENQYTLVDLLKHYGIEYQNKMVFDKHSFVQRGQDPQTGNYKEVQVYYIPEIDMQWGSEISWIKALKKLYFYNSASLKTLDAENEANGKSLVLLKSSPDAWVEDMSEGAKDANNILPPAADKLSQQNLIMATQGSLSSFFKSKDIPQEPEKQDDEGEQDGVAPETLSLAGIQDAFLSEGEYGRVLVSATSLVFDPQLLSVPTNASLALNLLDYMAGNVEMAELRARSGVPNFIADKTKNTLKNFIKWFNTLGLPLMVGILGLLMLLNWRQRQLQLKALFATQAQQTNQNTATPK